MEELKRKDYRIERLKKDSSINWNELYLFKKYCDEAKNLEYKDKSLNDFRGRCFDLIDRNVGIYVIWDKEEGGFFYFSMNNENNEDKKYVKFGNYLVTNKIEENLLRIILEEFINYDKKSRYLVVTGEKGEYDHVGEFINIELGEVREIFELRTRSVDKDLIENWNKETRIENSKYKLKFFDGLPDDLISEYSKILSKIIDDISHKSRLYNHDLGNEKEILKRRDAYQKMEYNWYQYLIFDEKNQIVGLTETSINSKDPRVVTQNMTGILLEHRGKGLSKLLKSTMYKRLLLDFPEIEKLRTAIHPKNEISKNINTRMGYVQCGLYKEQFLERVEIISFLKN